MYVEIIDSVNLVVLFYFYYLVKDFSHNWLLLKKMDINIMYVVQHIQIEN